MKDLSFFLFKNSVAAKMKKSFTNFCNNNGSTSTLNQHHINNRVDDNHDFSNCMDTPTSLDGDPSKERQPTLEEMILQLELEEEMAKKAKLNEYTVPGRMSCVNNSDILRSARNALDQYPRFSLDGKDAMYRSSFRNNLNGIGSTTSTSINKSRKSSAAALSSESHVVWCKPGVVARLMGLEAMPVPISTCTELFCGDHYQHHQGIKYNSILKRQNLRMRAERREMERKIAMEMTNCNSVGRRVTSSCSENNNGYCAKKPMAAEAASNIVGGGWPTLRFR